VRDKQASQKAHHDQRAREREWSAGKKVFARSALPGSIWVPATIVEKLGPVTYTVEIRDGTLWKRHADQLREFGGTEDPVVESGNADDSIPAEVSDSEVTTSELTPEQPLPVAPPEESTPPEMEDEPPSAESTENVPEAEPPPPRHYPLRVRKPREHYQ